MKNERDKHIKDLSTVTENHVIRIELSYSLGGINYFTGYKEGRGIYLHVSPIELQKRGEHMTKIYTGFSGVKKLIKPLNRFSKKAFDSTEIDDDLLNDMTNYVVANNPKWELP